MAGRTDHWINIIFTIVVSLSQMSVIDCEVFNPRACIVQVRSKTKESVPLTKLRIYTPGEFIKRILLIDKMVLPAEHRAPTLEEYMAVTLHENNIPATLLDCSDMAHQEKSKISSRCLWFIYFLHGKSKKRRKFGLPQWTLLLKTKAEELDRVVESIETVVGSDYVGFRIYDDCDSLMQGKVNETASSRTVFSLHVLRGLSTLAEGFYSARDDKECPGGKSVNKPSPRTSLHRNKLNGARISVASAWDFSTEGSLNPRLKTSTLAALDNMILQTLAYKFNITYNIVVFKEERIGRKHKDGCWNGVMGAVVRKEADLGVGGMGVTLERVRAVDFSAPYFVHDITFIARLAPERSKSSAILRPYTMTVWMLLMASLIMEAACLYMVIYISSRLLSMNLPTPQNVLWHLFGTFSAQGVPESMLRSPSCVVIVGSWLLFVIVILYGYSGTLTSYLTFPGRLPQPENFFQLGEAVLDGKFTVGTIRPSSIHEVLMGAEGGFLQVFRDSMLSDKSNMPISTTVGLPDVLLRNYALIASKTSLKVSALRIGAEKMYLSRDQLFSTYVAIVLPKGSSLTGVIDDVCRRLFEAGLIGKWIEDRIYKIGWVNRDNIQPPSDDVIPFSAGDLKGPFFLLVAGYLISAIVLGMEYFGYTQLEPFPSVKHMM